jgi:signal transduction histidine kinase
VLINLTSNARKFTPRHGGLIKLQANLIRERKIHQLQITVANNGDSIPLEKQKKLFKPFSKLEEERNLNSSGNGLGLSICKNICNNLGGDITVRSQPGDMTEFTFWVNIKFPE